MSANYLESVSSDPASGAGFSLRGKIGGWFVRGILVLESGASVFVAGWLLLDLVIGGASSVATAVALIVTVLIGAVWLIAMTVAAFRGAPWSRPSAIVWQILQISVAVGAMQGAFARPDVGWLLLIPAVTVIGLLLTRSVRAQFLGIEDYEVGVEGRELGTEGREQPLQ